MVRLYLQVLVFDKGRRRGLVFYVNGGRRKSGSGVVCGICGTALIGKWKRGQGQDIYVVAVRGGNRTCTCSEEKSRLHLCEMVYM